MIMTAKRSATIDMPSKKQLKEVIQPYLDEESSGKGLEDKIQKLMEFFDFYGIDYDKFKPEHRSFIEGKKAYPNYDQYMHIPGQHDTKRWLMAVKDIYYKQKAGLPYKEAIRQTTQGWKKMEVYDFLNWLRFYEEGAHMKYKTAQVWYENGQPGYFLHIKPDAPQQPEPVVDGNAVNEAREEADRSEEKKRLIEKQRQKIIGRLDSAEKLLRSPEGQMFAGPEMESLMEAIYSLKKKVQLVNKLSVSTRLYEDMIVREANVLSRKGFVKAADVLYSVAQTPGASAEGAMSGGSDYPSAAPPSDPSGAGQSGTMSGLPSTAPGVPSIQTPVDGDQNTDQPPASALKGPSGPPGTEASTPPMMPQEDPQPLGIKEFIENMNEGNKTEEEQFDDLEVFDQFEVNDSEAALMVTEAQAVPPGPPPAVLEDVPMTDEPPPARKPTAIIPPPGTPSPAEVKMPEDKEEPVLEVTEKDIKPAEEIETATESGFDKRMDDVLSNITIEDVIAKLEDVSKIFRTREIPRQLSIVDLMLDALGLASFFGNLAEAHSKSLDANQYMSTRIDDILSKLRGSIVGNEIDLKGGNAQKQEISDIKTRLQQDADKEKQRKLTRKEQENAELEGGAKKETPTVDIGELGQPATPVTPAVPPPPRD